MLSPQEVLDTYYLEARRDLLELAALLDRYDAAVDREGSPATDTAKLSLIRDAMLQLSDPTAKPEGRTHALLKLFAQI